MTTIRTRQPAGPRRDASRSLLTGISPEEQGRPQDHGRPRGRAEAPLIVVMGATALGKTAIAVELALRLGAEIVVADSMQVYAGLPILTNQPTRDEELRVPHHLVGFVEPAREYSVAEYAAAAHSVIDRLREAGTPVIIEGGSGLYVRAALGGLSFGAKPPVELRRRLEERLASEGLPTLVAELERRDPAAAARIDTANPRRVIRALESAMLSAAPEEDRRHGLWSAEARHPYRLFALDAEREELRARVDERVLAMIAAGALDEVRALLKHGGAARTVLQAIGVRELADNVRGSCSLEEAGAAMQARTRRLVRRQATWMRKLPDAVRIPVSGRPPTEIADQIAAMLSARGSRPD